MSTGYDRFGSLAAIKDDISLMSGFGWKADVTTNNSLVHLQCLSLISAVFHNVFFDFFRRLYRLVELVNEAQERLALGIA